MFVQLPPELVMDIISYMIPYCHVLLHEDILPNKSIYQSTILPPTLYMDQYGLFWLKNKERQSCKPFILCEEDPITCYFNQENTLSIENMDWTTFSYRNRIRCAVTNLLLQQEWYDTIIQQKYNSL